MKTYTESQARLVGCLGDVPFYVSSREFQTFADIEQKKSVNYSEHKLHKKKPLLEYTGKNADECSFKMTLSAFLGVNPYKSYKMLKDMLDKQQVVTFVMGTSLIGTQWVLTDITLSYKHISCDGDVMTLELSVTLKEYN